MLAPGRGQQAGHTRTAGQLLQYNNALVPPFAARLSLLPVPFSIRENASVDLHKCSQRLVVGESVVAQVAPGRWAGHNEGVFEHPARQADLAVGARARVAHVVVAAEGYLQEGLALRHVPAKTVTNSKRGNEALRTGGWGAARLGRF